MIERPKENRNYRSSLLGRQCELREAEKWLEIDRKHFGITGPLNEAERQERIALAWALHRRTNQPQISVLSSQCTRDRILTTCLLPSDGQTT